MKETIETGARDTAQTGEKALRSSLTHALARAAAFVSSEGISRGDRAELRRMSPEGVPPEVFWRTLDRLDRTVYEREEPFWMTVLPLMVRYPHRRGARPGGVLAGRGVKPARIVRWLRRDREAAWREAHRLLSLLKGESLDWVELGMLLHNWGDDTVRRRFARDFFRTAHEKEASETSNQGER